MPFEINWEILQRRYQYAFWREMSASASCEVTRTRMLVLSMLMRSSPASTKHVRSRQCWHRYLHHHHVGFSHTPGYCTVGLRQVSSTRAPYVL